MYRPNVSGVVAARLAKVPAVISQVHNVAHWDNKRQIFMDSLLGGWRDKVIAVSEAVRQDYIKQTGIAPQKCVVIYNGIDLEIFNCASQAAQVRQKWGIAPQDKVVGIIARLVSQKDHETFLRAAKLVKDTIPGVKFLVVGEEEEQGRLEQLEAQVTELGLDQQVIFTGTQRDIPAILSIMDVSVLSSTREGFSNVVLESMACGVPMVATDVGGNAEAIVDGETGFLVPPQNPQYIAERILNILNSPGLADSMRQASRERANLFSLNNNIQQVDQLYSNLLAEKIKSAQI
jgi:glycosyltransferase involved in cell wall biosynthesis